MTGRLSTLIARATPQPMRAPAPAVVEDPFENVAPALPGETSKPDISSAIPQAATPVAPEPLAPSKPPPPGNVQVERTHFEREIYIEHEQLRVLSPPSAHHLDPPGTSFAATPRPAEISQPVEPRISEHVHEPPAAQPGITALKQLERVIEHEPVLITPAEASPRLAPALPAPVPAPAAVFVQPPPAPPPVPITTAPERPRLEIGRLIVDVIPSPAPTQAPARARRQPAPQGFSNAPANRFGLRQI